MNQAFSANRQASRKNGISCRSQTSRTARRFAIDTGWPPPELLVTVTMTSGIRSRPTSAIVRLEGLDVHVALEGMLGLRVATFGDDEIPGLGTLVLDVGAGRVEVGVVGDHVSLLRRPPRRGSARRPAPDGWE